MKKVGAYLPGAYEEVVDVVDAYVLTEKVSEVVYDGGVSLLQCRYICIDEFQGTVLLCNECHFLPSHCCSHTRMSKQLLCLGGESD